MKKEKLPHTIINNCNYVKHNVLLDHFKYMIEYNHNQLVMYEDIIRECTGAQRIHEYKFFISYCEKLSTSLKGMMSLLYQTHIINNKQYDIYSARIDKNITFYYDRIGFELGL